MSEGLKPCPNPKCGCKSPKIETINERYYIKCKNCGACGPLGYSPGGAANKWADLPRRDANALPRGTRVKKKSGGEWQGRIVGEYSTELTKEGYAVESEFHKGSVQIYPRAALGVIE